MKTIQEACEGWILRIEQLENSHCDLGEISNFTQKMGDLKSHFFELKGKSNDQIDFSELLEDLKAQSLRLEAMSRAIGSTVVATELRNLSMDLLCATPPVMLKQITGMIPAGLTLTCRVA